MTNSTNRLRDKPPIPFKPISNTFTNNIRKSLQNQPQHQFGTYKPPCYEVDESGPENGEATVESIHFNEDDLKELDNGEFSFNDSDDDENATDESDKENGFSNNESTNFLKPKQLDPKKLTSTSFKNDKFLSTSTYSCKNNGELTNVTANNFADLEKSLNNADESGLFSGLNMQGQSNFLVIYLKI